MSDVLPMSPLAIVLTMLFVCLGFFIATLIVILLIRGLQQGMQGNSPRLTVSAVVTGKRQETYERKGRVSETCYVTFEADSGEQWELAIDAATYGLLSPGDAGQLTLRGTEYLGFVRN